MDQRQYSPSTARNKAPILAVLQSVLPARAKVLEIASGTGEHAVFFAREMPGLQWLASDPDPEARASIAAWIAADGAANVRGPFALDVLSRDWSVEGEAPFDAIVAINMIHISPWEATLALISGAARLLAPSGVLFTYGPYKRDGVHTAPSNEAFDASLKARNPEWGIRDIKEVAEAAAARGLSLHEFIDMPANNVSLVFGRPPAS